MEEQLSQHIHFNDTSQMVGNFTQMDFVDIFAHPDLKVCHNLTIFECRNDFAHEYGYEAFLRCFEFMRYSEHMSYEQFRQKRTALFILYGCILNVICILGLIGNFVSMWIIRSHEFKRSTTAIYLQALMILDSLFLISNYIHYVLITGLGIGRWFIDPFPAYSRAYILYNIIDIFKNGITLLTVAVTAERYIGVCHSLHAVKLCTAKRSRITVLAMIAIAVVYEIPRFFILKVFTMENTKGDGTDCEPMYLVGSTKLIPLQVEEGIGYLGTITFFLLPLVILSILTWLLLAAINKSKVFRRSMHTGSRNHTVSSAQANNEYSTTLILLSVVITFIVCNLPNTLIMVLRLSPVWDEWNLKLSWSIFYYIAIVLLNVNSAVNIILFGFFGRKFRKVFVKMFCRCQKRSKHRPSYQLVSQTAHTQLPMWTKSVSVSRGSTPTRSNKSLADEE